MGADETFHRELKYLADLYAPLKTVQLRRGYLPTLSDNSKEMIRVRNNLRADFRVSGSLETSPHFKQASKKMRQAVK